MYNYPGSQGVSDMRFASSGYLNMTQLAFPRSNSIFHKDRRQPFNAFYSQPRYRNHLHHG
jgi:hypothetical protein